MAMASIHYKDATLRVEESHYNSIAVWRRSPVYKGDYYNQKNGVLLMRRGPAAGKVHQTQGKMDR